MTRDMSCSTSSTVIPMSRIRGISRADFRGLIDVQAGGRFVQEQQRRFRGQGPRQLHRPLLAEGQAGGLDCGELGDIEQFQQFHGLAADLLLLSPGARQIEHAGEKAGAAADVPADHDVFQGGHPGKSLMFWKVRAMPRAAMWWGLSP